MWHSLISVVAAATTIGFKAWNQSIRGDYEVVHDYSERHFSAWFKDSPGDCIDLTFNENRLSISALSGRVWCLVFDEGQLVYPTQIQHGQAIEIPANEGMEVMVAFFGNHPQLLADRLGSVHRPLSLTEFNTLSQAWHGGGCSLIQSTLTRDPVPIRPSFPWPAKRIFFCLGVTLTLVLIAYAIALPNWMPPNPYSPGPVWINVFCDEDVQFSNLQLNDTNEWLHEMMDYCLNGTACSDDHVELLYHRKWRRNCNFTG